MSEAWIVAIALPALVAAAAIEILRRSRFASILADRPNERSLHTSPIPRVGGLGLMAAALPIAAWLGDDAIRVVVSCAAVLVLVSAMDDHRSLPIQVRLPAHIAAATLAVFLIASPGAARTGLGVVEAAAAILAIAWMTNLFNFMDGSDGLAGAMATIGFATLGAGASAAGMPALALPCWAIAAASVAFLARNFPPARVFLGDAGSVPLGFLAGSLGLAGVLAHAWPLWFPLVVFSPFIVDATVTLLRRTARGHPFWIAHRDHYYQRLVLAGWSKPAIAIAYGSVMAAAAASALAGRAAGDQIGFGIILAWAVFYLLVIITIERRVGR
jgi:UDP-GlcNAc:undecaprenyl-phosphate/decaprenyl-phosphate GlcNAc-1-phosphate transferase